MSSGNGRANGHGLFRIASVVSATGIVAALGATGTALAATPRICREAKVTAAVVRHVFGATATIGGEGVSESGRCAIESGVHGKPPSGCVQGDPTCINTDVLLHRASAYKNTLAGEIDELNQYGHAHKAAFSGAGKGAYLLTSTKGYGGEANPMVLFKAGRYTVIINGPFAGQGEPASVYREWEKLGRAIHARES